MKKVLSIVAVLIMAACETPVDVTLHVAEKLCPIPPPIITDTVATEFDALCPYRTVVGLDTLLFTPGAF